MKVVIIEDENLIIDAVNVAFEFRWPEVKLVPAMTGKDGIALTKQERPDLVILDINLPDQSGFNVLKAIREFSTVPMIILTVRSDDADVLRGLEAGADDYIIKPFNYLTLLARVKAILRRTENTSLQGVKTEKSVNSRLKIDFVDHRVFLDGEKINLTPQEYALLALLIKNKNKVVPYSAIVEEVWEKEFEGSTKNIRIYIQRLRDKLNDIPPEMIINRRNTGYVFKP